MHFFIDQKKNTILFGTLLLLTLGLPFLVYVLPIQWEFPIKIAVMILGFGFGVFQSFQCFRDYKTNLILTDTGLTMFRRGKTYKLKWGEIKRIEYSGFKRVPLFDVLVIHTAHETLYVEYTFSDYRNVWKIIEGYISQFAPNAIVDKKISN